MEEVSVFLTLIPLLILSTVFHEVSHGWVALKLGDRTAKEAGRLTLNPLPHIDPVGTIFLPLMLFILRSPFLFAWAKPVPINARNLRNPKRDMLWVGAAGPLTNFALAVVGAFGLKIFGSWDPALGRIFTFLVFINVLLGIFNLVPIPPLDGSRVLTALLPARFVPFMIRLERWGMPILMLLLFMGLFRVVLLPIVLFVTFALLKTVGAQGVL